MTHLYHICCFPFPALLLVSHIALGTVLTLPVSQCSGPGHASKSEVNKINLPTASCRVGCRSHSRCSTALSQKRSLSTQILIPGPSWPQGPVLPGGLCTLASLSISSVRWLLPRYSFLVFFNLTWMGGGISQEDAGSAKGRIPASVCAGESWPSGTSPRARAWAH